MSQQEFETYLSVLSRLLRLAPEQREQVAEELRDHLETRLEELTSQGVPHTEAVKMALDEFGDAAGVATSFFSLVREQRRRWVMRVTTISLGAAAALVLFSLAFWPEGQRGPAPRRAAAQFGGAAQPANPGTTIPGAPIPGTAAPGAANRISPAPRKPTELEQKLAKRLSVEFIETPLRDVLTYLSDTNDVQFYVNAKALEGEGVSTDAPVTLRLKEVRMDTVLDLALEQASNGVAAYVERDGVLIISEATRLADRLEVHVYNCRDLLSLEVPNQHPAAMGMAMPGASGFSSSPPASPMGSGPGMTSAMAMGAGGGYGGGGMGGMMGAGAVSGFGSQHDARASHLMQLVSQIVKPDSWSEAGGPGSIAEYGGLLVVRQNPQAHREVEKLLAMLREQAAPATATAK
jgi:hypothetical protein